MLIEAAHAGDIEAAVALYEPDASFVQDSGEVVTGQAAIREVMKGFLALKPRFSLKVDSVQSGDGTLALTRATWSLTGTDSEGKPVSMAGRSAEVVRRQGDGTWKFVIDHPHGSEEF
jgi:uncharacterized protein (TIGR02246 family)